MAQVNQIVLQGDFDITIAISGEIEGELSASPQLDGVLSEPSTAGSLDADALSGSVNIATLAGSLASPQLQGVIDCG